MGWSQTPPKVSCQVTRHIWTPRRSTWCRTSQQFWQGLMKPPMPGSPPLLLTPLSINFYMIEPQAAAGSPQVCPTKIHQTANRSNVAQLRYHGVIMDGRKGQNQCFPGLSLRFFPRELWGPKQLELEVWGSLLVPKQCRPGMLRWSKLGFSPLPDICQPAKVKGKHIKHTHIVCVSCKFFGPWVHFPNLIKECWRSVGCHLGCTSRCIYESVEHYSLCISIPLSPGRSWLRSLPLGIAQAWKSCPQWILIGMLHERIKHDKTCSKNISKQLSEAKTCFFEFFGRGISFLHVPLVPKLELGKE